jgi:hypothetical protein
MSFKKIFISSCPHVTYKIYYNVNLALSRRLGCGELVTLYEVVCEFVNLVLVPITKLNAFLVYFSQLRGVKVDIF